MNGNSDVGLDNPPVDPSSVGDVMASQSSDDSGFSPVPATPYAESPAASSHGVVRVVDMFACSSSDLPPRPPLTGSVQSGPRTPVRFSTDVVPRGTPPHDADVQAARLSGEFSPDRIAREAAEREERAERESEQ